MIFRYHPKSQLEKFGETVYNLLVENFSRTFYVGGMVRDLLLKKKVTDIDIATQAKPDEVVSILKAASIGADYRAIMFGVVFARQGALQIEIATLRKESYGDSRYPKISYVTSPRQDSKRRDFTVNSLYLRAISGEILDFHNGVKDLKNKKIRFIGKAETRLKQDPLRLIRALRFSLDLKFRLERQAASVVKNNFALTRNLTQSRVRTEILKSKTESNRKILSEVLSEPELLDKFFK